jgi:5-methylcytosine-specific restriction endonuclease McrA
MCQYCENIFDIRDLTYDHLIPKSKWNKQTSPTVWTNIVTACASCNRKKGNKTLQQANMTIKNLPTVPNKNNKFLRIYEYLDTIKENIPQEWEIYV